MAAAGTTKHVVLLPDLATGHLMSMIQAGIRISNSNNDDMVITVLLVHPPSPASAAKVATQLQRVAATLIRFHHLPAIDDDVLIAPKADELPAFKSRYMQLYGAHIKAALGALRPRPCAILLDMFATAVLDFLGDLPAYVYFTSTAAFLSLLMTTLQHKDKDGVRIPGMVSPVPAECMPVVLARRDSPNYDWFVYHGRRFMEARGIVINTVSELEQPIIDAIMRSKDAPPVYPIGPVIDIISSSSTSASASDAPKNKQKKNNRCCCLSWLDAQPPCSVVFLCFGSVGWLPPEQATELAAGLDRSGHRFLWVLRGPPAPGSGSHHLTDGEESAKLLPEGFLERTAARGMVWPAWAPQREILAHRAVGAFVTHAGWNSCLESLWHGLPMVPCPLYAEQHLNAFQAVTDMGVAVPLHRLHASEVERAVRSVMGETPAVREKAMAIKSHFRNAVAPGGSSHAALHRLCQDIRSRVD